MAVSDNIKGALLMTGSMVSFTLNDVCMKLLGESLPLFQAILLRGVFTTVALYLLVRATGTWVGPLGRRDRRLLGLRTVGEVAGTFFFLTALFNMPLADATAIIMALPLTVTLAAAVFLSEPVGWRRLLAIGVGFIGVLLIVQPGTEGFTLYALSVLAAVVFATIRDIAARQMSAALPSPFVAMVAAGAVTVSSAVAAPTVAWQPVGLREVALLGGAGLCILCAYLFSVSAMRVGEVAVVAPFRYTSLLAALVLGVVVFGDWPNGLTLAGAALVVAAGVFTLWRGNRVAGDRGAVDKGSDSV